MSSAAAGGSQELWAGLEGRLPRPSLPLGYSIGFQGSEPDGAYPLKLFDPRQPAQIKRLTEQHVDNGGSLSPDERWLAYQSAAIGHSVVYVRPMNTSGPAIALSRDPGEFPIFPPDGKTLALVLSLCAGTRGGGPVSTVAGTLRSKDETPVLRTRIGAI